MPTSNGKRSSLRIAVVTTHPPGKGTLNEYGYHFVRFLRQKPEIREVIVLADELPDGQPYGRLAGDEDCETVADCALAPMTVIPCWRFNALDNALRILSTVRRTQPEGVLFNIQFASFGNRKLAGALGLIAPALTKWAGYPTIALLHNIVETVNLKSAGFGGSPLMERCVRLCGGVVTHVILRADLVAVTIPKYVEILQSKYGAKNVLLAPHGSFEHSGETPELDPPPGPLRILTFGKFGTYKRIEVLIEAFRILLSRVPAPAAEACTNGAYAVGDVPPLELVIAGTDSPNAPGYLAGLAARYADVPGIRFTGYVPEDDIPRIFREASVVVFPYTSTTGSSGVLHQAGSYARAVVLPKIGDFAELITEEGYSGEFFEPGDAASLADAIARIIYDPARRRTQGYQNYVVSHGLPIANIVDWYLLHFEELLKQHKKRGARS